MAWYLPGRQQFLSSSPKQLDLFQANLLGSISWEWGFRFVQIKGQKKGKQQQNFKNRPLMNHYI